MIGNSRAIANHVGHCVVVCLTVACGEVDAEFDTAVEEADVADGDEHARPLQTADAAAASKAHSDELDRPVVADEAPSADAPAPLPLGLEPEQQALSNGIYSFIWVYDFDQSSIKYPPTGATGTVNGLATDPDWRRTVRFADIGGTGGNAQVVSFGHDASVCWIEDWVQDGTDERVHIRCGLPETGEPVVGQYVVQFMRATTNNGVGAYLWADQASPALNVPYNAHPFYSWNSAGGVNTVTRTGTGRYDVFLPGLNSVGGIPQVTAYGVSERRCKIEGWQVVNGGQRIRVRCFQGASPFDTRFSLNYFGPGEVGVYNYGAYAWADDASVMNVEYAPPADWSYNSGNEPLGCAGFLGNNWAGRRFELGLPVTGGYRMVHEKLNKMLAALFVSAYGTDSSYCKVRDISHPWPDGLPQPITTMIEAQTDCYAGGTNGVWTPWDTKYLEIYTTGHKRSGCSP